MANHHGGFDADHCAHRGAHAGQFRVFHDGLRKFLSGTEDAAEEFFASSFDGVIRVIKRIQVLHGDGTGHIAARVAPHAVGDNVEVASYRTGILVACSDLPNMGGGRAQDCVSGHKPHRRSSNELVPMVTGVFSGTGVGMLTRLPSTKVPLVESKSWTIHWSFHSMRRA